jgi:PTH2 family peptidyl-tRNA hydrolase
LPEEEDQWEDDDSDDSDDYARNQAPVIIEESQLFAEHPVADIKMVLVVNDSLKMGKGKIGAQCGHATLSAYQSARRMGVNSKYWTKVLEKWSWEGTKKICVKVKSDEEIIEV